MEESVSQETCWRIGEKLPKKAEFHRNETSGYTNKDVLFVRLKSTHLDRRVGFIFLHCISRNILYEILINIFYQKGEK